MNLKHTASLHCLGKYTQSIVAHIDSADDICRVVLHGERLVRWFLENGADPNAPAGE